MGFSKTHIFGAPIESTGPGMVFSYFFVKSRRSTLAPCMLDNMVRKQFWNKKTKKIFFKYCDFWRTFRGSDEQTKAEDIQRF